MRKLDEMESVLIDIEPYAASIEDYCTSILRSRDSTTWWYQKGLTTYSTFFRPFRDSDGRWWWPGKLQFSYPIDFFSAIDHLPKMPFGRSVVGWQCPATAAFANSNLYFNLIHDLEGYEQDRLHVSKGRAIRRGLRDLEIELIDPGAPNLVEEVWRIWNSHVQRTSWNKEYDLGTFRRLWHPLADMAGTAVLGARVRETGQLCAWLIARMVGSTVYLDTLASQTEMLEHRPNDALVYVLLCNAGRSRILKHANFFRYSGLEGIERFKSSMGFDYKAVRARFHLSKATRLIPKSLQPASWNRALT